MDIKKEDIMNFTQMEDYNNDPKVLDKFGRNIVEEVKKGKIDPVNR